MKTTIEATYTAVTPVFCAGADTGNAGNAEVRLTSFKGVLRFWWRALAWSKFEGNLETIRESEDYVFGSASRGQSRLLMRLAACSEATILKVGEQLVKKAGGPEVGEGCRYLGYGLMEAYGSQRYRTVPAQLRRSCITPPYSFTVSCLCKDVDEEALELVYDALQAIGLFGGLGARSRRGYGSLVLSELRANGRSVWKRPSSVTDLRQSITELLREYSLSGLPDYSALSRSTRCMVLEPEAKSPLESLDRIGRELIRYRSYGHNSRIFQREKAERNFKHDHDLMQTAGVKNTYPERIAFGLPQNYFFSSTKVKSKVSPADRALNRRASPLLIHVHGFDAANTPSAIVLTFMPARFLPIDSAAGGAFVDVGGSSVGLPLEDELYEPIHRFMDRLLDPLQRGEPFSAVEEIVV